MGLSGCSQTFQLLVMWAGFILSAPPLWNLFPYTFLGRLITWDLVNMLENWSLSWDEEKKHPPSLTKSLVSGWWTAHSTVNHLSWFAWNLLCWPSSKHIIKSGLKSLILPLAFLASQCKDLAGACPESMEFSTVCDTWHYVCVRACAPVQCTQACLNRHVFSWTIYTYRQAVIKDHSVWQVFFDFQNRLSAFVG